MKKNMWIIIVIMSIIMAISSVMSSFAADIVNIPDPNFKVFLVNHYDTNGDGEIQESEAQAVTGTMDTPAMMFSGNITDLTGIEAFTNLTGLVCSSEQLSNLDVSANTKLTMLNCDANQLTVLDVSANTSLINLNCSNNRLTILDVSANTNLTKLECSHNQLTSLDVGANSNLTVLSCCNNRLAILDVSANSKLTMLYCCNNQLTVLDVSANNSLIHLECSDNQLTSLDVSANNSLKWFFCRNNRLANIPDVTSCLFLESYDCSYNNFDIDDCTTLVAIMNMNLGYFIYNPQRNESHLCCTGNCINIPDATFKSFLVEHYDTNQDGEIEESEAQAVTGTMDTPAGFFATTPITDLTGIEAFTNLTGLICSREKLTYLDVSANTLLTKLDCSNNQLADIPDVTSCLSLDYFDCSNNYFGADDCNTIAAISTMGLTTFIFKPQAGGNADALLGCLETENDCQSNDGFWYDSLCHVYPSECRPGQLQGCTNETECVSASGYWYGDGSLFNTFTCHEFSQYQCRPGHLQNCTNETECAAAGGCGFYQSDNSNSTLFPHTTFICQQCPCQFGHCGSCSNETECVTAGGYWYGDGSFFNAFSCHDVPLSQCQSGNLMGCHDQAECRNVGGYWYNSTCNATPQPQCRADNLTGCTTQNDCQASGGYWYNSACNINPQTQSQCQSGNLISCTTQTDCVNVGGYWYNYTCNANPPFLPGCRANNLSGCTTQNDCQASGGYWYDSSCHSTPQNQSGNLSNLFDFFRPHSTTPSPTSQSVYSYPKILNPIMQSSPANCQPFAIGDLSTGNLNLQVGLPTFSSGVDVYLAIGFSDALFLIDGANELHSSADLTALPKWKTNVSASVNESLYGDISISLLPAGLYNLYIAVVPTGEIDFSHYYFWATNFKIDESTCVGAQYYWYDNACHVATACNASNLSACDTEEKCISSGFSWSNGSCTSILLNDVFRCPGTDCSPTNLSGCKNSSDCHDNGGWWYSLNGRGYCAQ